VDEILPADGADLAGGEATGDGHGTEKIGDDADIVVGFVEQP
jgi:hypothetical protein